VELLPADTLSENSSVWSNYNTTTDGYLVVGSFDSLGVAEGLLDAKIGAIKELRLHVHSDSENTAATSSGGQSAGRTESRGQAAAEKCLALQ